MKQEHVRTLTLLNYCALNRNPVEFVMMASTSNCPLCESFAAPNIKGVVRHIGLVHAHEASFRITCGVDGCTRTYRKFFSYKKHMYVKHRDVLNIVNRERSPLVENSDSMGSPGAFLEGECEDQGSYVTQHRRSTALFILKAREVHKIPQSSLDYLLGDISNFMDANRSRLLHKIAVALRERGIHMEDELLVLSSSPDVTNPFDGLHTEYLQQQYFIEHFNLVVGMPLCAATTKSRVRAYV